MIGRLRKWLRARKLRALHSRIQIQAAAAVAAHCRGDTTSYRRFAAEARRLAALHDYLNSHPAT